MKLSMQIIADGLRKFGGQALSGTSNLCVLVGVRIYESEQKVLPHYVYIALGGDLPVQDGAFISIGHADENGQQNAVLLPPDTPFASALCWVQEIFEFYAQWDSDLQKVLNDEGEIKTLLSLSLPVFQNPMFVHDPEFYLIAMAGEQPEKSDWVLEEVSNKYIFNSDLINLYKIDPDYMASLTIHGGAIFPEVIREYPILIFNLFLSGSYVGRICINAKKNPILPGQLQLIEHLGEVVLVALRKQRSRRKHTARVLEIFLSNMLDKKEVDREGIFRSLSSHGWKNDDCYVCIKVGIHQRDEYIMSLIATCNRLETVIPGSFAFPYNNSIAVIVNLSRAGHSLSDCLALLATFLREGLFKSGSSNAFCNFMMTGEYYRQASAALEIGAQYDETIWSYRFDHYVLRYFFQYGCSEMPPELLCSKDVLALIQYDKQNHTKLYETLQAYIANKLNATQTARALFIHRSTFFYRLDRIKSIISSDLEDERQCFHMQLSFMLLEDGQKQLGGS